MAVGPRVEFPAVYDEIFYPGRLYAPKLLYVYLACIALMGAFFVYLGLGPVRAKAEGVSGPPIWLAGAGVLVAVAIVVGGMVMSYVQTAVALTADGVYYRDWRARVWFIAWSDLDEVAVQPRVSTGDVGMALKDIGEEVYVAGRVHPGGRTRLKLATTHNMRLVGQGRDMQMGPIAEAITRRAGLVPGPPPRPGGWPRQTWVRPDATQPSTRPSAEGEAPKRGRDARAETGARAPSAQPARTECKWCGETFPQGTTTCPQCGRPVPQDG